MEPKQKLNNRLRAAIITALVGGSAVVGNQVGKPNCDFVVTNIEEDVCLSQKQVDAIFESLENPVAGFGGIKFGGDTPGFKEK